MEATSPVGGEEGGVLDEVANVGGFGQTDEQVVLQSTRRVVSGMAYILLGIYTQLALLLKKRQYERLCL